MIDLHTHSTFSDGTNTPAELIDLGVSVGLSAMALTDHDTTDGIHPFLKAAEGKPIRAIPGVEISADFDPGTMHFLGYFVDHESRMLREHLDWIRNGREMRNEEIFLKLHRIGFRLSWDDIRREAGEDMVGRPHFARALIARGYVKTMKEAFDQYLAKKRPAYAERRRLSPEATLELIRSAGGVSVLAHPYSLQTSRSDLRKIISFLREQGLDGLEVFYSEYNRRAVKQFGKLAKEFNLVQTGGSDFHGDIIPDIKLGTGMGSLKVPDEVLEELEARRPKYP